MTDPIELTLSEDNEIGFKLRIEGSDKDIVDSKPNIRFTLSEQDTGKGWFFPAEKTEDGVSVSIPSMKGIVSEDKEYCGKLEIIMGGHYFTPTEVDVRFNEPLKVEAAVVTVGSKKNTEQLLEEATPKQKDEPKPISIESEIDNIIIKDNKKKEEVIPLKSINEEKELTVVKPSGPVTYNDLSPTQKSKVNALFLEKCEKLGISNKEVKSLMKEGTSYTKNKLTLLLAQSVKEFTSES